MGRETALHFMKSITKLFLYLLVTLGISVQSSVQNEYSSFSVIGKTM